MTTSPNDALALASPFLDSKTVFGTFLLFCRIGACLMLAPGLSHPHIPMQARLFVALAVTLALAPLLLERTPVRQLGDDPIAALRLIATETLVGGLIGLLARMFLLALETLAAGAATMLGVANPLGVEIEADQALAPLTTLINLAALTLLFAADLHWEILRGLTASYSALPMGADLDPRRALRELADALDESFLVALRVSSPFVIYGLLVNLAISLVNRLTPQIAVFYIATPFVAAGGLVLLYFTIKPLLDAFLAAFGAWLMSG